MPVSRGPLVVCVSLRTSTRHNEVKSTMRFSILLTTLAVSLVLTAPALARHHRHGCENDDHCVPEIGADGSLAAITAVAGFAAILGHRRRRSSKKKAQG